MTSMPCRRFVCLLTVLLSLAVPARAHHTAQHEPAWLGAVSFEQRLQEFIPLDVVFWDETGRQVPLRAYFGRQPVIPENAACPYYGRATKESRRDSRHHWPFGAARVTGKNTRARPEAVA